MITIFKQILDYMCENLLAVTLVIFLIIIALIICIKKINAEVYYELKCSIMNFISETYPVLIGVSVGIVATIIIRCIR